MLAEAVSKRKDKADPRLLGIFDGDLENPMFEYQGRLISRGEAAGITRTIKDFLDAAAIPEDATIGLVARSRPGQITAMLALIADARPLTMIYPFQSAESMARDIGSSHYAAVIAEPADWTDEVRTAARDAGTLGIAVDHEIRSVSLVERLETLGEGPFRTLAPDDGLEVLSSGTTGTPKRIALPSAVLARCADLVSFVGSNPDRPFEISSWALASIGGVNGFLGYALIRHPIVVFDKFNVAEWTDAVRRHRPKNVNGVPAMARMILDAKIPREDLASVQTFYGGSAPFSVDLMAEFESTYGIKVLWAYGATEFGGAVISWSPNLYDEWKDRKRGSSGRAVPGVDLRVVDADGTPLPPGAQGLLEARIPHIGDQWIHTNDLVVIDEDGFMFHHGRADGAIVRGGFKILPETISDALRTHPSVLDAAVVKLQDRRLGETPGAAVEIRQGEPTPTPEELESFLRQRISTLAIPTRILILETLPRTPTMKVALPALQLLFQ